MIDFNFLGFNINLSKNNNNLPMKDVDCFNFINLEKISKIKPEILLDRLKSIELDLNSTASKDEAVARLLADGIFIIPNFFSEKFLDGILEKIESKTFEYQDKLQDNKFYEDDLALIQYDSNKVKGYNGLSTYPKTVFDIRAGLDQGMIDVFNVDKIFNKNAFSEIYKNEFLTGFLERMPNKISMKNINSYINSGVTSTRGFHVDSYNRQIKIFIYLTDVLDLSDGPYTYVKGTHLDTPYRRVNKKISESFKAKTETPLVPFENIYPILAAKGSLVVSDQSGFHRGFPQQENGYRRVLTINCK